MNVCRTQNETSALTGSLSPPDISSQILDSLYSVESKAEAILSCIYDIKSPNVRMLPFLYQITYLCFLICTER